MSVNTTVCGNPRRRCYNPDTVTATAADFSACGNIDKTAAKTTKTVKKVAKKVIDKIKKSVKDGKTSKAEGKNAIQNVKSSVAGVSNKSDAKSVIQKLKETGGTNDLYKYLDENIDYYKGRKKSGRGGRVENSKMDGFYYFDKDLPIGQQLVSNVMKQKSAVKKSDEVSELHDQCKKMKNCSDLKNQSADRGCGYCGATQKFLNYDSTDDCQVLKSLNFRLFLSVFLWQSSAGIDKQKLMP